MSEDANTSKPKRRLPPWLRRPMRFCARSGEVRATLKELKLATVCSSAMCPNIGECFSQGTATFMILGEHCTRSCSFCAIDSAPPSPVREDEPDAVAEAAVRMGLRHVVITSVTRDDLPDGGAEHFARVCRAIRGRLPEATIEILTPDFQGRAASIEAAIAGCPDVFNHNIETVARLYAAVRPQADYRRSLDVLRIAREVAGASSRKMLTKSGLMVGIGETRQELTTVLRDLREVGCDAVTIGQYLAPSSNHYPVVRYVEPSEFDELGAEARDLGFVAVASAPLVRSSYHAADMLTHPPTL